MSGLTKETLQGMLDEQYSAKFHRFERDQEKIKGKSAADRSQDLHNDLYVQLSKPLKAVQAKLLRDISKNCYKEKHMAETFTNMEQINLCKALKKEKYMGQFNEKVHNVRDSTRFRYQDCVFEAENNIEKATDCIKNYLTGM